MVHEEGIAKYATNSRASWMAIFELEKLKAVGFSRAGKRSLANNVLRLTLEPSVMNETNVL